MSDTQTLPVAFYFNVAVGGTELSFKEVSGLTSEVEMEEVREGGLTEYVHKLPKQVKQGNLVLKRALRPAKYWDVSWIAKICEGDFINYHPKDITIKLLDADHSPIYTWLCEKAYPVKWEVETLGSDRNEVLIESMEFAYTKLSRPI